MKGAREPGARVDLNREKLALQHVTSGCEVCRHRPLSSAVSTAIAAIAYACFDLAKPPANRISIGQDERDGGPRRCERGEGAGRGAPGSMHH